MANSEHGSISIDIEELATSLQRNIATLLPISNKFSIYRVPQSIRGLSESAFTPQVVSIGPLHHGKPELQVMEEHKRRYLRHFLQRTQVSIAIFLRSIKDNEVKLRNCYAETIELKRDEFVTMILVDAVFIIEYFLRSSDIKFVSNDDCIFGRPWIRIWPDLLIVENQLPCFILNELFDLAKRKTFGEPYAGITFIKLIKDRFKHISVLEIPLKHQENLIESHFSEAKYLLDFIRLCLETPQSPPQSTAGPPQNTADPQNIPTVMELHQAGVKFMLGSQNNLLDIKFNGGIIKIPLLAIYPDTEILFRNLLAFERLHCGTHNINDYVLMMTYLVNTASDVELLVQNGVIKNWLADCEAVSTLFHNLRKQTDLYTNTFLYSGLVDDLNSHCNIPWHKWKANLKQNYFNTPWASISVAAAVILLLLTVIQAVCSIIAL